MKSGVSIEDFSIISLIGKGNYSKVYLVKNLKDNNLFALKVMKKKYIVQTKQEDHIMTQKNVLAEVDHPFLVKLKLSFQNQKRLYFVLQYCPGGQLFNLLSAKQHFSEEQAKFYAAQVFLALDELHKHKVIYRDLKPQNIIIDKIGYIKLTDFGLSKILSEKDGVANSICGTPQYLAPQIIKKEGHGVDVDWWCFGCFIHQIVTGFPPFNNQNRKKLFQAIIYDDVDLSHFSPKLQNLLGKLLKKNPRERIGHKSASEIKNHPWFEKIDWESLLLKKLKPPFLPELLQNIDEVPAIISPAKDSPYDNQLVQKFKGFSWE